jgi:hypothetical protein
MGVPTSEVGYTTATTGRGDHEVHKGHVVALGKIKIKKIAENNNYGIPHDIFPKISGISSLLCTLFPNPFYSTSLRKHDTGSYQHK